MSAMPDESRDNALGVTAAGSALAAGSAVASPLTRTNAELVEGLRHFATLPSRHPGSDFAYRYVDEASGLINKPLLESRLARWLTLPNIDRLVNPIAPSGLFKSPEHRFHTRSFSRGPVEAYAQLAHESKVLTKPQMLAALVEKAHAMGLDGQDVTRLSRIDQMRLLEENIGSRADELMHGSGKLNRIIKARMFKVPTETYGKAKLPMLVNIGKALRAIRYAGIAGGLGLAGYGLWRLHDDGATKAASSHSSARMNPVMMGTIRRRRGW